MKNNKSIVILVLLFFIFSMAAFAEYNKSKVKTVMRGNVTLMGEIGKAIKADDFQAAAESLMKLAQGMISIQNYTPYRGTQESWDSTIGAFINTAFKGIGASGAKDIDGLNAAFAELRKLNGQGHKAHK